MFTSKNIAERIEQLTKEQGANISTILKIAGVNSTTVSNMKRNKSASVESISKIAKALNVSIDYLLGNTESRAPVNLINDDPELTDILYQLVTRAEMRTLFQISKNATEAEILEAVRIIEAIRNKP